MNVVYILFLKKAIIKYKECSSYFNRSYIFEFKEKSSKVRCILGLSLYLYVALLKGIVLADVCVHIVFEESYSFLIYDFTFE